MHIEVDASRCIGAGNCALTVPEVFDQREDDGTGVVLDQNPPAVRYSAVDQAVQLCPSAAISVTS